MSKHFKFSLVVVTCLFLVSALMAVETGEIKGKVTDEEGVPLPGVTITTRSPSLQGTRSTVSGENGDFRFPLLPVGKYSLTFELPGFQTMTQKGYEVSLGFTASINVTMKVATVEEEITVTAESPIIDKTKTDTSYRLSAEDLARAPAQARTIQEIVAYTPGVTGVRSDTLDGSGTGLPSFRGEGEEGNNWLVDGLSVSGTRTNDPGVEVNFDTWEEVQVVSDGFTPDFESAVGGIINIVTKSGGNEFHGELGALIRDWHLRAERQDQLSVVTEPDTSIHQYYGNIGGPIIRDKVWFFLSDNLHRTVDDTEEESIGWLTYPPGQRRRYTNNAFGKLTFSPHPNHTFFVSGTLDKFLSQSGGTGLPERYTKTEYTDYAYRINYKGILTENTLVEAAFGQSDEDAARKPLEENYGPPQYYFKDISQYTNNASGDRINIERRTDATVRFTQYIDSRSFGNHEIGAGLSYYKTYAEDGASWTGIDFDPWPGNGFDNGIQITWVKPGEPESMTEYMPYGFWNDTKGFGFYLKDNVTIERFSLMLGVRSETQKVYDDTGKEIWAWGLGDFLSPRVSVAIDLLNDGKNILKFGYGRFSDTVTTRVLEFFNSHGGYGFRDYEWIGPDNPSDAQLKAADNWSFVHEQSPASNPMHFDPDVKPNKTDKFLVEFDRSITANWALKVRGVYSESKNLLEDVAIWQSDLADPYGIGQGWWYWYLTNYEEKRRDYKAVEVELNGRIADRFMLNASYTWSEAKGTNPGQFELGAWTAGAGSGYHIGVFGDHCKVPEDNFWHFLDDLTADLGGVGYGDEGWYGFLPYSVDHQVKVLGTYLAPYDFIVTAVIEYISGYHWEKHGWQAAYRGYYTYPEGRGVRTTPAHVFVDFAVEKNFVLTEGFTAGLRLNANNVLNSQKPVSYVRADTDLFGEVWGRQNPRWLQFHVILRW
ncbi:MAG: carboxypeptidase regulatory-like domain-containing protein [Candidatus Aminicenantes bacterium]